MNTCLAASCSAPSQRSPLSATCPHDNSCKLHICKLHVQGFLEIERGINSLQIEGSDCWYAEPDFAMEEEVLKDELQGSMFGVVDAKRHTLLIKA